MKYIKVLMTAVILSSISACSSNKHLNCLLIPLSKNCHINVDRLNAESERMNKLCRKAKYDLIIAQDDAAKQAIAHHRKEVEKYCFLSNE